MGTTERKPRGNQILRKDKSKNIDPRIKLSQIRIHWTVQTFKDSSFTELLKDLRESDFKEEEQLVLHLSQTIIKQECVQILKNKLSHWTENV